MTETTETTDPLQDIADLEQFARWVRNHTAGHKWGGPRSWVRQHAQAEQLELAQAIPAREPAHW